MNWSFKRYKHNFYNWLYRDVGLLSNIAQTLLPFGVHLDQLLSKMQGQFGLWIFFSCYKLLVIKTSVKLIAFILDSSDMKL